MRKVPVHRLKPGMKVGRSVITSEGILLIRAGITLSNKIINRLKNMDIPSVYIDDGFINDIELVDVISEETRADALKRVRNIFSNTKIIKKGGKINYILDEKQVSELVNNIIDNLLQRNDILVSLSDIRSYDDYTYGHSVNVCVLALLTGNSLGLTNSSLFQLGAGALLHDLGKIMIPKKILNKPTRLTDEEFDIIKRHTIDGYKLIKSKNSFNHLAASVIYEHHERLNGTGYPRGLKGNDIHLYGKIVGLVDVYDALTADRVYRNAYLPHQAYEMLAGAGDNFFDYEIITAFLKNIAMYPIGSFVELSTGQIGIVVKNIKGLTHRPTVRIYFEKENYPVDNPYEIDLVEKIRVMITKVLDYDEVEKLTQKMYN